MIIIAIDFDGTCVTHDYPRVGEDIGAVPILKALVSNGVKLILFTMRDGKELNDAVEWFKINNIPLFGVNENPEQKVWTSSVKPYANLYIDDAGLGIPLFRPENKRPYVNWKDVSAILKDYGFLNSQFK